MECKNCGCSLEKNFCPNCGQKSNASRIDFKFLLAEIPSTFFQVNRGFFYTAKELVFRPGHTIREYFEGKRNYHYKPIAYFIVTTTLYVALAYLLNQNTLLKDLLSGMSAAAAGAEDASSAIAVLDWIAAREVYFLLMLLPLFSLSTYLAFIRSKYNYFEHLVINLYLTGQQMFIYIALCFWFEEGSYWDGIPSLISIGYNFFAFNQLFENKKVYTRIFLIILAYILFAFLFGLLIYMVGFSYDKVIHPN